jgi:molybdate transport system substrate-binding protein
MTTRPRRSTPCIAFVALLALATAAPAAELKVLGAVGVQEIMESLGPKFEQASGNRVVMTFATLGPALKRIEDGETADVVVLPAQGIDRLVKEGKAAAEQVSTIARSMVGVAVRKGTPKPDISSPEAFRQAMLAAKSILISDPARGGVATPHILKVFERLGIAEEMKRKTVYTKITGAAGIAQEVAKGEVDIGLNQLQEFAPVDAMEIVGPFPGDLGLTTLFSAVVMGDSRSADTAKALISSLRTPEAATVIKAHALAPAFP